MRVAALALALLAPAPGQAACRLALSLGLDVSSSVDAREYRLQTAGLAAALVAPEVVAAFLAVPGQPVMLHIFEWSGWQQQQVRQDWVTIAGEGDLVELAARLRSQPRSFEQYPTALGLALLFGRQALAERTDCARRTLDISGDGTNNDGVSPEMARRDFPLEGITVNGLVIGATVVALSRYYKRFVIQGPGAFVEEADDYQDFERTMRRKLLRELGVFEISGDAPRPDHEQVRPGIDRPHPACAPSARPGSQLRDHHVIILEAHRDGNAESPNSALRRSLLWLSDPKSAGCCRIRV